MSQVLAARWVLVRGDLLLDGGGVRVEGGRVRELLENRRAVRKAAEEHGVMLRDFGDGVLTPGLVNAHAHLELGWARGLLGGGLGFARWVGDLVRARAGIGAEDEVEGVGSGARELLGGGTTCVGDIDASGAMGRALVEGRLGLGGPRTVRFREVLDAGDPTRREAALARVAEAPGEFGESPTDSWWEGLSPHAPFTCSPQLLRRCAELARARELPIQVHWAESEEERNWLLQGSGPFAKVLEGSPHRPGLELLAQAGLLGPKTSLVHANLPEEGDVERVARAGASVVHCPGTHAFFGRSPFDWEPWLRAGVPVALGTDSLASNAALSLPREMALARAAAPELDPETVWEAVTHSAARALGLSGQVGALEVGCLADCAFFDLGAGMGRGPGFRPRSSLLEALTLGEATLGPVLLAGETAAVGGREE